MGFLFFLLHKIKALIDYSGLITKFIIGFGICLILLYFWYIDYFPTDLSLGDGLLFFLITIKFLLVYLLFLSSHYALGRIVIFVLSGIIKIFIFLFKIKVFFNNIKNITWVKVKKIIDKISIKFIKFIFYIFGFVLIFLFYNEKSLNLLLMIFLSILLAYCIDIFIKAFRDNNSKDKESMLENTENKNLKLSAMLIYILFFPSSIYLFYSEKPNNFLINSTLASIREDDRKSIIFIKFGLKDLFPESKIGERKGEYIELKNTEILLRGIGKNALVQYQSKAKDYRGNDVQIKVKVEIPNDSLLVVRRSYSRR
ncbi:hypothetical protein [Acinetobacter radioresistens]|uniref:hypothetical protein n=1 Tax=Acinetobacter radioresistens TaxID=40216 RepID=UPI000DABCDD3|nr:hypothetical protein [Acinetobacter radioresistens]AWV87258.1 hypothetical protein DOM24_11930 [Acinetobacter radioresistens]MCX0328050.1 hypothetical protein [Acinetobacter radioresistens]